MSYLTELRSIVNEGIGVNARRNAALRSEPDGKERYVGGKHKETVTRRVIDEKDVPEEIRKKAEQHGSKNESSCSLAELRAISEASSEELRYINYINECARTMNEVHTGAIDSIKHVLSHNNDEAKGLIQDANRYIRDGKKAEAKKAIDRAIKILKENRKEAEQIDDDGLLEHLLIAGVMSLIPGIGSLAYSLGYYAEWYCLRKQSDKGDEYSKAHPSMRKNLAMEFFFGKLIAKGYSRSAVLSGYDDMIAECEAIKRRIDY